MTSANEMQPKPAGVVERRLRRALTRAAKSSSDQEAIDIIAQKVYEQKITLSALSKAFTDYDEMDAFIGALELKPYRRLLRRALQKKDIHRPIPWLDRLLTVIFIGQVGLCFYAFSDNQLHFTAFCLALVGVALCVVLSKVVFTAVGTFLSRLVYRLGWTDHEPLKSRRQMKKWLEQAWQLVIHVSMSAFEVYLLADEPWLKDTATVWQPRPDLQYHKLSLRLFYITQLVSSSGRIATDHACALTGFPPFQAIWVYTCIIHRFIDERRKDYFVMYIHHVITIALVCKLQHHVAEN